MNDTSAPVAARNDHLPIKDDANLHHPSARVAAGSDHMQIKDDANLHVRVGAPTKRFHLWVQGPAWLLGFTALGLGFLMVLRGYDSPAGWFAVSTSITL